MSPDVKQSPENRNDTSAAMPTSGQVMDVVAPPVPSKPADVAAVPVPGAVANIPAVPAADSSSAPETPTSTLPSVATPLPDGVHLEPGQASVPAPVNTSKDTTVPQKISEEIAKQAPEPKKPKTPNSAPVGVIVVAAICFMGLAALAYLAYSKG